MRRHSSDIRSTGGGFGVVRVASSVIASLAREIIAGGGRALWGPALHAPVLDETGSTKECLEPLRLTHRGITRVPKESRLVAAQKSGIESAFKRVEHTFRGSDMQVNEFELARQVRHRAR